MKFGKKTYGGGRPVFTSSPLRFTGGFNLDTTTQGFNAGDIVPAGTLAVYDESTRKVKVLKTGKVKAIDAVDAKIVTLESSMHIRPIFKVGDQVLKTVTGLLSAAPVINSIAIGADNGDYVITLSAVIAGLAVGDVIVQVVADATTPANAALIGSANAAVIASVEVNDGVNETGIDITIDSGAGAWYARRILPIPATLMPGNVLLANPNIKFTQSF
ncbi:MAG: hypothetical protein M1445_06100 [Bacteroidetes bacterium]|nr:hypothetical protein [Bacteroidota bacterium]